MMHKKTTFFRKTLSSELTPMIYLCRFHQRNRLIEIPVTNEYYNQQNGLSHDNLKNFIIQEFQLNHILKTKLIIQIWNEQYQEYIDIESFKRIPFEGRLQVLIENDVNSIENSPTTINHQRTNQDESINASSYDLLPKPTDGIPIPRFPPHISAFLNGTGDANQLNALVQVLYQEIVKYDLYPNADELRSIISRLVDRYPNCVNVIGSIELLVRKLYYKFCNERKKYPLELKRRQPNKRKRLIRDDDENIANDFHRTSLDCLMNLWTTNDCQDFNLVHSPRSNSSSSISNHQEQTDNSGKTHPLNLSLTTNSNLLSTE